ncbi:hypothetical protein ABFX02_10G098500 [Erythranthe guttata]
MVMQLFKDDLETGKLSPQICLNYGNLFSDSKKNELPIRDKKLSRVFSEDYDIVDSKILDPRGTFLSRWNKCFLISCLVSLFVDPLFFYLLSVKEESCMQASIPLEITLTIVRTIIDTLYVTQILVRFRTAYVAPSSRVFGRGELVIDSSKIASKYLRRDFWLDLLSALPLPQLLIWAVIPCLKGSNLISAKHGLRLTIIIQFILRLSLIFPLSSKIISTAGVVVEAAWAGAALNLLLFMLASHVIGSCWYLLSVERQEECWKKVCDLQRHKCKYLYFDCDTMGDSDRMTWFLSSNITKLCGPRSEFFNFGIYADALTNKVGNSRFLSRYFYCLWWGLRNLSSIGQNLVTTTYIGEINFAITIAILGLVLFALLIGNMQTYLQSSTARLEEWRVRRNDTEQWMHHRKLPREIKERVRKYDLYKWVTTRGVEEDAVLSGLPLDLRRDIKHHLCLDLVRRVPLFDEMDACTLDAICERLRPILSTPGTILIREGDPVIEMLFILRGRLESYTTDGGRAGFFNSCSLGSGDFCGEELLSWALYPRQQSGALPSSTRTVTAASEVEAFALSSSDVKFVASQFRKMHSKQLKHKFRFHSHQWRTWAACSIQAAWFRYRTRKAAAAVTAHHWPPLELAVNRCASLPERVAAEFGCCSLRNGSQMELLTALLKPVEPDFTVVDNSE